MISFFLKFASRDHSLPVPPGSRISPNATLLSPRHRAHISGCVCLHLCPRSSRHLRSFPNRFNTDSEVLHAFHLATAFSVECRNYLFRYLQLRLFAHMIQAFVSICGIFSLAVQRTGTPVLTAFTVFFSPTLSVATPFFASLSAEAV